MPDNPPAFSRSATIDDNGWSGMTLRDYFAAKAMQGAIAEGALRTIQEEVMKTADAQVATPEDAARITNALLAKMVYEIADAMLLARE